MSRASCPLLAIATIALSGLALAGSDVLGENSAPVFDNGEWVITLRVDDPAIPEQPMQVSVDGVPKGAAKIVQFANRTEAGDSFPQVVVVASSGFLRLKPGADPSPPIPFGTSVVLGPAYWESEPETLFFNPQLETIEIDTGGLSQENGTVGIAVRLTGSIGGLDVEYELRIPEPTDFETTIHVRETFVATRQIALAPGRIAAGEAFRLVQLSSMYLDEPRHDSDGFRFRDADGGLTRFSFADVAPAALVPSPPLFLGEAWVDALHGDDAGFQGNTPNVRVRLEDAALSRSLLPRAFLALSADPNQDNVGIFLHDTSAPARIDSGARRSVEFTLVAHDDPFLSLDGRIIGVNYGPFRDGQSPERGVFPSAGELAEDAPVLASIAEVVRTYSAANGFDAIVSLGESAGIRVVPGAFVTGNPVSDAIEIDALVSAASNADNVPFAVVGSEALLRGDLSEAQLIALIEEVREKVPVPLTTAEPWHIWLDHPGLADAVDLIFANVHPYFDGVPVENAIDDLRVRLAELKSRFTTRRIVISETGWPTAGGSRDAASPGVANQERFAGELLAFAETEEVDFFYFEAFDEAWKTAEPNGVGPHWGLFDSSRQPKHSVVRLPEPSRGLGAVSALIALAFLRRAQAGGRRC